MSLAKTSAVALRVQTQLRRDHRSMAMVLLVPCMLLWILQITFANVPGIFDRIGPLLLGVFPFTLIFLVTSITMLRERNQGTLDRMLISPMSRFDIMVGYSVAFGALAIMQSLIAVIFAVTLLDMPVNGNIIEALMIVALVALYGIALGLTLSAFARSEFQAVQFMPLFLLPQIFLSGLLVPVQQLPTVLRWLAYVNPLKYVLALLTAVSNAWRVNVRAGSGEESRGRHLCPGCHPAPGGGHDEAPVGGLTASVRCVQNSVCSLCIAPAYRYVLRPRRSGNPPGAAVLLSD